MKIFFYLLILLLPTQFGRHFWPDFSFLQGIRVDYLSPTIYLTDILIICLLATWTLSKFSIFLRKYWLLGVLTPIIIGVGIYFSQSPLAGLYGLAKFFEFLLLGFYIAKTVKIKEELGKIIFLLVLGLVFESSLAITQFIRQSSLGGIFWFLGERTFTSQTPGIANAVINGQLVMRPYGTFSHPNVLAGFLVIVMILMISQPNQTKSDQPLAGAGPPLTENIRTFLFIALVLIGSLTLVLTMSRVAIILWFIVFVGWFFARVKNRLLTILTVLLIVITTIFLWPRFIGFSVLDESIIRRWELTISAVQMLQTRPFFGVGINNFLVNLPEFQQTKSTTLYLQPVHNIYLLILAETGVAGLLFFSWFIIKTFQKLKTGLLVPLAAILILGVFDHYWLTLQQGQLLFTLVFGLSWAKSKFWYDKIDYA